MQKGNFMKKTINSQLQIIDFKKNSSKTSLNKNFIRNQIKDSSSNCFELQVDYSLTTNFSQLPPEIKKGAKILRMNIFEEKSLAKISQTEISGYVSFVFFRHKRDDNKIEFSMPCPKTGEIISWNLERKKINPQEGLSPWYNQNKYINARKKFSSLYPLSSLIHFHYSNDFGFNNIKNYFKGQTEIKLKDLAENSQDELNMDFSELISHQKYKHYRSCYQSAFSSKLHTEIEQNILDTDNYASWKDLQKQCSNDEILYKVLHEIVNNEKQLKPEYRDKVIAHFEKMGINLKDDLDKIAPLGIFTIDKKTRIHNDSHKFINLNILNVHDNDLQEVIESQAPYLNQKVSLEELQSYMKNDQIRQGVPLQPNQNKVVTPASVNSFYNLLDSSVEGGKKSEQNNTYTAPGDIVVSDSDYSFKKLAIVDSNNAGRPLGNGVRIIGHIHSGKECELWTLLKTKYIKEQISIYADVNIKRICYRTLFDKIYINSSAGLDFNINELSFNVASLALSLNTLHLGFSGHKIKSLIHKTIRLGSIERQILDHKIEISIRNITNTQFRECLIIHNNKTQNFAKQLTTMPASSKLCNVDIEKQNTVKKIVNSDMCLIALSFDNFYEVKLAKDILKIIGSHHIFIQEGKSNSFIGDTPVPDNLLTWFGNVNFCETTQYNRYELAQNITQVISRNDYLETVLKDFLICLSECNVDSFRRIQCKGQSNARRQYNENELAIFKYIQKDLIHKAYALKPSHISLNPIMFILYDLEHALNSTCYYNPADDIWSQIKNMNGMKREKTITSFVTKHKAIIKDCKSTMPNLYEIATKGIKSFRAKNSFANAPFAWSSTPLPEDAIYTLPD
jgi:hypothetical protein